MSSANGYGFSAFPPGVGFDLYYYRDEKVQTLSQFLKLATKLKIQFESQEVSIENDTVACCAC